MPLKNASWLSVLCLCAALGACCLVGAGDALTIYRLSGADLPAPEEGDFVPLSWEAVDEGRFGATEALEIAPGFIAPEQTDPNLNLAPSTLGGGFSMLSGRWEPPEKMAGWAVERFSVWMIDGDSTTTYQCGGTDHVGNTCRHRGYSYMFAMGKQVFLDRIHFFAPHNTRNLIPRFIIGASNGDQRLNGSRDYAPSGQLFDFDILHDGPGAEFVELALPPTPTERLLLQIFRNLDGGATRANWELTEFEFYAIGYAPFARYTSNVIDLGEHRNLGPLSWTGEQADDTRVEIYMRSGDDQQPDIYWRNTFRGNEKVPFNTSGAPLDQVQYNKLELSQLGGVTHDLENWTSWSPVYDFAAGRGLANADRPRRFVQFDIAFHSTPEAGGSLNYLQLATSPRLVTETRAEISPPSASSDEITTFTYKLRARVEPSDAGFDGITIETPARVHAVESAHLGGVEIPFNMTRLDEHGFDLELSTPIDLELSEELVEVKFQAQIFAYDTPFTGRLFNSATPGEIAQTARPGDADKTDDSNTLRVALNSIPQNPIQAMRLASRSFSPNGDQINDVLHIDYELLNLRGGTPTLIQIYDLAGRHIADLPSQLRESGLFRSAWNGRDYSGALVDPGLYILQLKVLAVEREDRARRLVSVVY